MTCTVCSTTLFTWEADGGRCREHGMRHSVSAYDLGSILPPLPMRNSVRVAHRVLTPTEEELRAVVAEHQALTPAMRKVGALTPFSVVTAPDALATMDAHRGIRIVER